MPKPAPEDQTPEAASMSNAISSRTIEAVSTANRRDQTQQQETEPATETGIDLAATPTANTQPMGDVPPKQVFKPLNYRKTGPRSVEIVSNDTQGETDTLMGKAELSPPLGTQPAGETGMGDVPATAASIDPPGPVEPPAREDLGAAFKRRMEREGRWREVSLVRDSMMKEVKKRFPDIEDRRAWVYSELDRMYPPVQAKPAAVDTCFVGTKGLTDGLSDTYPKLPSSEGSDSGSIQGLSDLPKGWPELAMNASLAADVGWVQANRLRVVEERPGKATLVRLDLALSPAPSWAALGWLETSIRSYAKFVDVAAKVSGGTDDEGAVMRRERKSVDEVKALLREMEEAEGTCPHCGRPR
jgi:hypothetical protein